jgi:hypothetical protein
MGCGCKKKKTERALVEADVPKMSITVNDTKKNQQT